MRAVNFDSLQHFHINHVKISLLVRRPTSVAGDAASPPAGGGETRFQASLSREASHAVGAGKAYRCATTFDDIARAQNG